MQPKKETPQILDEVMQRLRTLASNLQRNARPTADEEDAVLSAAGDWRTSLPNQDMGDVRRKLSTLREQIDDLLP